MSPGPIIRQLTAADQEAWNRLQYASYGMAGRPEPWQVAEQERQMVECRGLFVDGRLAAALHHIPMRVYFGSNLVASAGLANVASAPETRRQGHAFHLLSDTLRHVKEQGCVVSELYPFAFGFYRRLGWEQAADVITYEVPLGDLPLPATGTDAGRTRLVAEGRPGEPEQIEERDLSRLMSVYDRHARRYNGLAARSAEVWRRSLLRGRSPHLRYAVLWEDAGGEPQGYLVYLLGFFLQEPKEVRVRELVATSDRAYRGLLGYLRNQEALYQTLKLSLPPSDPFPLYLPNPRVKRELQTGHMLRIIDLPRALEAAADPPPDLGAGLILTVTDPRCDWNSGSWQIECDGGTVQVTPAATGRRTAGAGSAAAGPPAAALGIGVLAQLITGYVRAGTARQAGRLEGDDRVVTLLEALFGRRASHLSDYF